MSIYIAFKDSTNPSRQPQKELSLETDDSGSPRDMSRQTVTAIKPSNEKSQLCKKFMENGNCPYQKKCKFAHGSHQLRKNSQLNSKYKTKECGAFRNEGYCTYGNRCNFIHQLSMPRFHTLDPQYILLMASMKQSSGSRLLKLVSTRTAGDEARDNFEAD